MHPVKPIQGKDSSLASVKGSQVIKRNCMLGGFMPIISLWKCVYHSPDRNESMGTRPHFQISCSLLNYLPRNTCLGSALDVSLLLLLTHFFSYHATLWADLSWKRWDSCFGHVQTWSELQVLHISIPPAEQREVLWSGQGLSPESISNCCN